MNHKNIYIILTTVGVAGVEKRFFELWLELSIHNPVYIVMNKITYDKFDEYYDLKKLNIDNNKIITYTTNNNTLFSQIKKIFNLRDKIKFNSVIHFPHGYVPFLCYLRKSKLIISWVAPYNPISMIIFNPLFILLTFLSFFVSNKIDILNEYIYLFFKKLFFLKNKISLTNGISFTDSNKFYIGDKNNDIIFLGRFVFEKGILDFINSIKFLDNQSIQHKLPRIKILIVGFGKLDNKIKNMLNHHHFMNIDISIFYTLDPSKYLSNSKIFLSLQKYSNYPSKSLSEAMLSGCIPIITNTPDSDKMIDKKNAFFIDKNFNRDELVDTIIRILKFPNSDFLNISIKIRNIAKNKFSKKNQLEYFFNLYFNDNFFNNKKRIKIL